MDMEQVKKGLGAVGKTSTGTSCGGCCQYITRG